jgi:peptidyl-prolyl cis-trans isomerase A (cyclophilin A)
LRLAALVFFAACTPVSPPAEPMSTLAVPSAAGQSPQLTAPSNPPAEAAPARDRLLDPSTLNDRAPDRFEVTMVTSKGEIVLEVHRDWAPVGADRFFNLVRAGFYDGTRFFRAIDGFMVQFGINGDPAVSKAWKDARIKDDPAAGQSNLRGMVTFAKTGAPDSRTTQLFINLVDNSRLDSSGFVPFAKIARGMEVVDALYKGYGEGAPPGQGPEQSRIQAEGNTYLEADFPKLDFIKTARTR